MTRDGRAGLSSSGDLDALINDYVDTAIKNGAAIEESDSKRANREARRLARIKKKLDRKNELVQGSLLNLLNHVNPWVRSVAAFDCLEFAEAEALETIKQVARLPGFVGVGAEWFLRRREKGRTGI